MNKEPKNTSQTQHHYYFGHVAIKQFFFYDPESFIVIMASEKNYSMLGSIWEKVREEYDHQGEPDFSVGDILIVPVRIGDYPCSVIKMPPVHHKGEVYIIGALLEVPLSRKSVPEDPPLRYFTLEKTIGEDGKDSTLLSSTDQNYQYKEYVEGLPFDEMTFIRTIEEIVLEG